MKFLNSNTSPRVFTLCRVCILALYIQCNILDSLLSRLCTILVAMHQVSLSCRISVHTHASLSLYQSERESSSCQQGLDLPELYAVYSYSSCCTHGAKTQFWSPMYNSLSLTARFYHWFVIEYELLHVLCLLPAGMSTNKTYLLN